MGDNNNNNNNNYYNEGNMSYVCSAWAPVLGFTGIACSVVFASKSPAINDRAIFCKNVRYCSVVRTVYGGPERQRGWAWSTTTLKKRQIN